MQTTKVLAETARWLRYAEEDLITADIKVFLKVPVRLRNRTYRTENITKLTHKGMSEYAFDILNWLGDRTYRLGKLIFSV